MRLQLTLLVTSALMAFCLGVSVVHILTPFLRSI